MSLRTFLQNLARAFGRPERLEDRLPWWLPVNGSHREADIWTTKTGGLLRVGAVVLPDAGAASPQDIIDYHKQLGRILNRYGDGWRIMFDMIRLNTPSYLPECDFGGIEAARMIDAERRGQFGAENTFDNAGFISIRLLPQRKDDLMRWMTTNKAIDIGDQVDWFDRHSKQFFADLAFHVPHVSLLSGGDLATYLSFTANYRQHGARMPTSGALCSSLSGSDWYNNTKGDPKVRIGDKFMATVEVKDIAEAHPDVLEDIYAAPFPLRIVTTYEGMNPETRTSTLAKLEKAHSLRSLTPKGWAMAIASRSTEGAETNPESLRGIAMVQEFKANPHAFPICKGWATVTTWGASRAEADQRAAEIEKRFNAAGILAAQATLNDYHALMANIPGLDGWDDTVCKWNLLIPAVTRLAPVTGVDIGPAEDKWLGGPALAVGMTRRGMPYKFAITRPGSDLGHIAAFGKSGSGKSVLANLFASHFLRYLNSRILMFDVEQSALVNCLCHGGDWTELGGSGIGVQPLRYIDDPHGFREAHAWVIEALREQGLTIEREPDVNEAVTDGMKHVAMLPANERTLSRLQSYCSMNQRVAQALGHYCAGQGPYGRQYDGVMESYGTSRFICIEIAKIIDDPNSHLLIWALFQALYREVLNGKQPTLWIAEELATIINHPVWGPKLEKAGLTMRKHWVSLMLITQDPRHFNNPAGKALLKQMATRLFFPDRGIKHEEHAEAYLRLGLTPHMLDVIAEARPKGEVAIQTETATQVAAFDLGPLGLRIIGAGTAADKARAFEIWQDRGIEPGEPFLREWLRETTAEWKARVGFGERRKAA